MRGHGRNERLEPLGERTATLWCVTARLAVLLAAYWFAAAIYSTSELAPGAGG